MFKNLRTIILLLLFMLLLAVVISIVGCTRTTQKVTETHDTLFVGKSNNDTTLIKHLMQNKETLIQHDTVLKVQKDTVLKSITKKDSIIVRDSVFVKEKGDSVWVYKEHWNTKIIELHDTVHNSRTDTAYQINTNATFKLKTDTLVVYKFIERNDSVYGARSGKSKVVKENRTLSWLKLLGVTILIFAVIAVLKKLKDKNS